MIELPFHGKGEGNIMLEIKGPLLKGLLITMTQTRLNNSLNGIDGLFCSSSHNFASDRLRLRTMLVKGHFTEIVCRPTHSQSFSYMYEKPCLRQVSTFA